MIDDKFRTDLQALVTAFLEGGGARSVAVDAMDEIGDIMWQEDISNGTACYPESDAEADEWDEEV